MNEPSVADATRAASSSRSTARPCERRGRHDPRRVPPLGIETPTLCYGDTLTPVNVCRVCVVEVEGARTLVPACSRKVEAGMVVLTDSERVRTSRRLVLELLGSSVDLSTAPEALAYIEATSAAARAIRPRLAATVAQAVKVDNELYVRDYSKCILCYKCVEACGDRPPEHVRDRRRRARVRRAHLDRARRAAARVGVRLLRQLHRRLPDRRADGEERVRPAGGRRRGTRRSRPRSTPSARTAASAATSRSTCRTAGS